MLAAPAAGHPVTPAKRNGPVEDWIHKLNFEYALGVQLPDPTLTPSYRKQISEKDEHFARSDRICTGIRVLYWKRDGTLERALDSFFSRAKEDSLRWVPKPRADPDTLPSSRIPPKAQTSEQRVRLQTILIGILDDFKLKATPNGHTPLFPRRSATIASGAQPAPGVLDLTDDSDSGSVPESPASAASKRSWELGTTQDGSAKRLKRQSSVASTSAFVLANALDNVPTRQHPGSTRSLAATPIPDRRPQGVENATGSQSVSFSDSFSTKASTRGPSIFSQRDAQSSQSTVQTEFRQGNYSPSLAASSRSRGGPRTVPVMTRPGSSQARALIDPSHDSPPLSPASPPLSHFSESADIAPSMSPTTPTRRVTLPTQAQGGGTAIRSRLQNIWPKLPRCLEKAPLAVAWEITRLCLHCNVDLDNENLRYDPKWATDVDTIWRSLRELDVFRGKTFPERPAPQVFAAALADFEGKGNNAVLMSASLEFNPQKTGPLFLLEMKPLKFDEGCRLTRRFGPDRFLEILIPSPTASNAPAIVKENGGSEEIIKWLTETSHSLVGRQWRAFFAKDAGYRKPLKEFRLGPEAQPTFKERVYFFAENGHGFRPALFETADIPTDTAVHQRAELKVSQMLDWLLQLDQNESQPHLKLFSRIQLGLSKAFPALTFEEGQIIHQPEDILSPIRKVMNDGIARMSRTVARKIRDALGLSDIPSAIQGRMGSAKGMWLLDVTDSGDTDWIETYPSQRKWKCNWADPYHRTLEVRQVSSELKSAGLNLQFLPVLEAQAKDKGLMRKAIGARLENDLRQQFESQKLAFDNPLLFRQWINESWSGRPERVKHGHVPFLGGLPDNKGEVLNFLLNSGFDPKKQKYVQDLAWDLQKQRCEILKTKLNIKVGRSAYVLMVVDFWGVLEEGEVHLGFSSKFRAESELEDASYTLLADCDVLVARSPAHFVSDIQKVRAVFKPELHALKDVIVFSAKGDVPLADKLSGGDYDGDLAWVCWDPEIVDSFTNADVPLEPDLSAYMDKDETTFADLIRNAELRVNDSLGRPARRKKTHLLARDMAVRDMITKSFQFTMQPNYLGICTNYKERLCYHNNSVSNFDAIILSTLVGKLVDQRKQGIIFSNESWDRLRRDYFRGRSQLEDPAYKSDIWTGSGEPRHIIDYLKFSIAKPAIDRELTAFYQAMQSGKPGSASGSEEDVAHDWDRDLAVYYEGFKKLAAESRSLKAVLESLLNAIAEVYQEWKLLMGSRNSSVPYPDKVRQVYAKWCAIEPRAVGRAGSNRLDPKMAALLDQSFVADRNTTFWALLKASATFKTYYKTNRRFVWQIAGRQLAFIKAQMTGGGAQEHGAAPLLVTPLMYAGLLPDGRFVKQYVARMEGGGSEYPDFEEGAGGWDDGDAEAETGRGDDID